MRTTTPFRIFTALAFTIAFQCTSPNTGRENVNSYIESFAPQAIKYPSESMVLLQSITLTPIVPSINVRKGIDACTIAPPLPAGLIFDTKTCAISGSPTTQQTASAYLVTASNDVGSKSQSISIAITASVLVACQNDSADATFTAAKCTGGQAFTNETGSNTTISFKARLSTQPLTDTTLTVATTDASEGRLATTGGNCDSASSASQSTCSITFTTANWNTDQTIKIIAYNDFVTNESPAPNYSITIGGSALFQNITSNQMLNRLTFKTTNTTLGNFGGVTSADNLCMNDPGHPDAALPLANRRTFKAFIHTTSGQIRQYDRPSPLTPSGRIDWVLTGNATYYQANGTTVIATADATGKFSDASMWWDYIDNISQPMWMAMRGWTGYQTGCGMTCPKPLQNCNQWSDGTNTRFASFTLVGSGAYLDQNCDVPSRLWCIQQ